MTPSPAVDMVVSMAAQRRASSDDPWRVASVIGASWWRCDEDGIVMSYDGPRQGRVGGIDGDVVGRSIYDDWPNDLAHPPLSTVARVLARETEREECTYAAGDRMYWSVVTAEPIWGGSGGVGRGALVVTHPLPRGCRCATDDRA